MKQNSIMQAGEGAVRFASFAKTSNSTRVIMQPSTAAAVAAVPVATRFADATVASTAVATPAAAPAATHATTHAVATAATAPSTAAPTPSAPSALTDAQLYRQCKYYGKQAKGWMRKFESLLPEVYRRRLYKRRGFSGIHEFAQKLAGMSRDKVDKILRLYSNLESKPKLREVFESGNIGYSKIEKVAYVATQETDMIWAHRVETQTQLQLERAVRAERFNREETTLKSNFEPEKMTDSQISGVESASVLMDARMSELAGKSARVSFNTNPETERKLRALQRELERERGEKLSLGETIEILINREHENLIEKAQRKRTISYCPDCVKKRADETAAKSEVARAVPAEIRHTVLARQNYMCAGGDLDAACMDGSFDAMRALDSSGGLCTHPPTELHHVDGWALTKNHDPDRMRYLCKKHHSEVHAGDPRVQAYRNCRSAIEW